MDSDEAVGNNQNDDVDADGEEDAPKQRRYMDDVAAVTPLLEIRGSEGIRKKLAFSVNELMSPVAVLNGEGRRNE